MPRGVSVAWQLQKKKPKGLKTLPRAQKRTLGGAANNAGLPSATGVASFASQPAAQPAVHPPSIERFAPVIWDAASEQRKTASAAT
jgi:hypothetical protein